MAAVKYIPRDVNEPEKNSEIRHNILCHFSILILQSQIAQITQLLSNRLCEFRIGVKICVRVRGSSFRHYHFLIAVKPTVYSTQRKMQDFFS